MNRIFQQTPTWVFFLFFFLVYLGYLQSKTRELSTPKLVILPVAMIALSIYGVLAAFGLSVLGLVGWAAGVGGAVLLNGVLRLPRGSSYSVADGKFIVAGSWTPMALFMAIFFLKYFISASLATKLLTPDMPAFAGSASFGLGLLSGTFFARSLEIGKSKKQSRGSSYRAVVS